jgi:hypothetical protein
MLKNASGQFEVVAPWFFFAAAQACFIPACGGAKPPRSWCWAPYAIALGEQQELRTLNKKPLT